MTITQNDVLAVYGIAHDNAPPLTHSRLRRLRSLKLVRKNKVALTARGWRLERWYARCMQSVMPRQQKREPAMSVEPRLLAMAHKWLSKTLPYEQFDTHTTNSLESLLQKARKAR